MRSKGDQKKGRVVAKPVVTTLMLKRRRQLSAEVMSGKFRVKFQHWEEMQSKDEEHPWLK